MINSNPGLGARHPLKDSMMLYDSYHCSRYNTQTRRLTEAMFHVFGAITHCLDQSKRIRP